MPCDRSSSRWSPRRRSVRWRLDSTPPVDLVAGEALDAALLHSDLNHRAPPDLVDLGRQRLFTPVGWRPHGGPQSCWRAAQWSWCGVSVHSLWLPLWCLHVLRYGVVRSPDFGGSEFSFSPASRRGGGCGDNSGKFLNLPRFGSGCKTPVLLFEAARQGQMREPSSPSPICGKTAISRLSSVKRIQNLQLNSLPPVHKSERPSVEPPARHQLASTISEAFEDSVSCFCVGFLLRTNRWLLPKSSSTLSRSPSFAFVWL